MMDTVLDTTWNETTAYSETLVDTMFLVFNCLVLSLVFLLGLPGNLLVCWVVFRNRSLQTPNNALLVNLAASDLVKCSVDTPLFLFSVLLDGRHGEVSVLMCALQQFTYALCSCVQLLTLVSISVERFQAIAFPFHTDKRKARIWIWIPSIWACGLLLAILSLTLSKQAVLYMMCRRRDGQEHSYENEYQHSDPFGVYVLVPVWGCCVILIVVHYARIFKVVRQHSRKVFDSGIQLRPSVAKHIWTWHSFSASAPVCSFRSFSAAGPSGCPQPTRCAVITVSEASSSCTGTSSPCVTEKPPEIVGAVCLLTPTARELGKKRVEGKLAQRLGYIIIAFTLFWIPLVVTMLLDFIDSDSVVREMETTAMVLTSIPAAMDPLIYTMVTRQFRSEFSKLLSSVPGCCPPTPSCCPPTPPS